MLAPLWGNKEPQISEFADQCLGYLVVITFLSLQLVTCFETFVTENFQTKIKTIVQTEI
jgi:hypothetical protein